MLYVGVARLARSLVLDEVLAALETDIAGAVATGARRRVFVHAAVVGWHGRALVMLGTPAEERTRLVDALVRAGARYYADRYAVLDARGRVHPFATSRRSHDVGRQPLPVGVIAVITKGSGARWRPRALTQGQAVLAMLEHAVSGAARPAFTLRVADAAVASAHALLRGRLGDESDVATSLLAATEGRTHAQRGGRSHAISHPEREAHDARGWS
jgi:hypothetical protein